MAIAFVAATEAIRTATTDPFTWTHTAGGTLRGVCVVAIHNVSATDHVTTITYGGVSMTEVVRATDGTTEPGAAEIWFLGQGIPTGDQTVSVDLSSATGDDFQFVSIGFSANLDTRVLASVGENDNQANPSAVLAYAANLGVCIMAMFSGLASAGSIAELGTATLVHDHTFATASQCAEVARQTTPGTGDYTAGFTSATDDCAFVAAAFTEVNPARGDIFPLQPILAQ